MRPRKEGLSGGGEGGVSRVRGRFMMFCIVGNGGVPDVFWSGLSEEEISGKNVNTTPKTVTSVETMVAQMPGMIARLLSIQTVETMSAIMTTAMIKRLLRSFLLLRG